MNSYFLVSKKSSGVVKISKTQISVEWNSVRPYLLDDSPVDFVACVVVL